MMEDVLLLQIKQFVFDFLHTFQTPFTQKTYIYGKYMLTIGKQWHL